MDPHLVILSTSPATRDLHSLGTYIAMWWELELDRGNGFIIFTIFYINRTKRETTWTTPPGGELPAPLPPRGSTAHLGYPGLHYGFFQVCFTYQRMLRACAPEKKTQKSMDYPTRVAVPVLLSVPYVSSTPPPPRAQGIALW